jgi:hypothetical protein
VPVAAPALGRAADDNLIVLLADGMHAAHRRFPLPMNARPAAAGHGCRSSEVAGEHERISGGGRSVYRLSNTPNRPQ